MKMGHISSGRRRLLALTALGTLGALTAGCAGADRAVVPAATTSAQVSQPAATGATNPAGAGATNPAAPATAPADASTADEPTAGQQLDSVDQDLAQALDDLNTTDQATGSGESDVPGT